MRSVGPALRGVDLNAVSFGGPANELANTRHRGDDLDIIQNKSQETILPRAGALRCAIPDNRASPWMC